MQDMDTVELKRLIDNDLPQLQTWFATGDTDAVADWLNEQGRRRARERVALVRMLRDPSVGYH